MQRRRRGLGPPALDPSGRSIEIEHSWWDKLAHRRKDRVANFTLTDIDEKTGHLRFRFLEREILVETHERCLMEKRDGEWEKLGRPMLELTVLDYFSRIDRLYPMGREMVGSEDLSNAHYFTGRNRLQTVSLRERFGTDPDGFAAAGKRLGGKKEQMADVAFRLTPFPRVPVYYLLWLASEEFAPRISIFFDRSIDKLLSPPAIWCLVSLCTYHLLSNI
jgi:hypothetical protein